MYGPMCEYWWEQEARMCGHASCYTIANSYQNEIEEYEL